MHYLAFHSSRNLGDSGDSRCARDSVQTNSRHQTVSRIVDIEVVFRLGHEYSMYDRLRSDLGIWTSSQQILAELWLLTL